MSTGEDEMGGLGRPRRLRMELSIENPESCDVEHHVCSQRAATVTSTEPMAYFHGRSARWSSLFELSSSTRLRDGPILGSNPALEHEGFDAKAA